MGNIFAQHAQSPFGAIAPGLPEVLTTSEICTYINYIAAAPPSSSVGETAHISGLNPFDAGNRIAPALNAINHFDLGRISTVGRVLLKKPTQCSHLRHGSELIPAKTHPILSATVATILAGCGQMAVMARRKINTRTLELLHTAADEHVAVALLVITATAHLICTLDKASGFSSLTKVHFLQPLG